MVEGLRASGRRSSQSRLKFGRGEAVGAMASLKDTSRSHVALQITTPASGREVVVQDLAGTRTRVKEPIVPDVDGHVIDPHSLAGEQHQVARLEGVHLSR
jgi:hypothetical protein